MLILMRRCDESVIIGNDIEVKVLKIQGNQVHLGIEAPRDITVYRHEIWLQVLEENRKALQAQPKLDKNGVNPFKQLMGKK